MTFPQWVAIPAITSIFALGGAWWQLNALADELEEHEQKPMHESAIADVATIKSNVSHNKEAIADLDKAVKELEDKIDENQAQLLEALRNLEEE